MIEEKLKFVDYKWIKDNNKAYYNNPNQKITLDKASQIFVDA